MKENKVRKLILAVLFLAIAVSVIVHFSVQGADTKSKISKQVSIGREMVLGAEKGNDNGQYSEYSVLRLSQKVEAAASVMTNRDATEDQEKQALESITNAIEAFDSEKNQNSLSAQDIQALMEEGGKKEQEVSTANGLQAVWQLDGTLLTEAKPLNLDIGDSGLHTEQLVRLAGDQYGLRTGRAFSLRHDGALPGKITLTLKGSFLGSEDYRVFYYEEAAEQLQELEITPTEDGGIRLDLEAGGDYIILAPAGEMPEGMTTAAAETPQPAGSGESSIAETGETVGESEDNSSSPEDSGEGNVDTDGRGGSSGTSGIPTPTRTDANSNSAETPAGTPSSTTQPARTDANQPTYPVVVDPTQSTTHKEETTKPTEQSTEGKKPSCTIKIRCETILKNMDDLREGLESYVPGNGIILQTTKVELYQGESVFDVLKRVTRESGIKLEFRNDAVHGSGYIVGINHLNELDCGSGSGWMYTVNDWFPNYGCAKYTLQDGDVIEWIYTCDLGRDIGGNFWE